MGIYEEYLNRGWGFPALNAERKEQLKRIGQLHDNNDVFVYAADLSKGDPRIQILYEDLMPIEDQLQNLTGTCLDVILETPGGVGEVAEDIVKTFRKKYQTVNFIIPGCAKSAGTIMALSGDDILMGPMSCLGPIDAQIQWRNQIVSADALIKGFEKIKDQAKAGLNRAYIPILSNISPGEIIQWQNAKDFAHDLITEWLVQYKWKNWHTHKSTGLPVTADQKDERAKTIAEALSNQNRWRTHGRSIKMDDLRQLRLEITDFSKNAPLYDAIQRYYILLRMTFEATSIFKLFETPTSQIVRHKVPVGMPPQVPSLPTGGPTQHADSALIQLNCPHCSAAIGIQAKFDPGAPTQPGTIPFPADNQVTCPNCRTIINVQDMRLQLESQAKRPILV
jgi:hypothetical protein